MLHKLLPMLLMLATCLPLFERSMDRFSISIQRGSVRTAAALVGLLSGADVQTDGNVVVVRRAEVTKRIGEGEQRFGFRVFPASVMLALYLVFLKPRSVGFLVAIFTVAIPILLAVNVIRVVVWVAVQWLGELSVADGMPRNVSAISALLMTFLAFWAICALIDRLGPPPVEPECTHSSIASKA